MTDRRRRLPQYSHGVGYLQSRSWGQVKRIWRNEFPKEVQHHRVAILEKAWMSLILLLDCVSLCDTMKWVFFPDCSARSMHRHYRRCFVDIYALFIGIGLPVAFLVAGWTHGPLLFVAGYLVAEMFVSTMKVLFVNVYDKGKRPHSPSRSVVLLMMGYVTVILAFALFYKACSSVVDSGGNPVTNSGAMVYFSLITIATVGYGDLHPSAGSAAVWLASLEVAIGIIMIVVLLTRFLGLTGAAWSRDNGGYAGDEDESPSEGK